MLFVTLLTLFVLYSMATNNSNHIIILDSDQTFNNLFTTKTISHVDIKIWWTYVDYIQQHYLVRRQKTAFTIRDHMHLVVDSQWISDSCFTATGNSSDDKVLTAPCHRIEYKTWKIPPSLKDTHIDNSVVRLIGDVLSNEVWNPTYRVWRITAYHKFTINITIYEAFVPLNEKCEESRISIHNGHNIVSKGIRTVCGHISMEYYITIGKTASLQVYSNMVFLKFPIKISASYEAISKGSAYRIYKQQLTNNSLNLNDPPDQMDFIAQYLEYYWYVNSVEIIEKDSRPMIFSYSLILHRLTSNTLECNFSIYPGLLSKYLTLLVSPYYTLVCNVTDPIHFDLKIHRFTTLLLRLHISSAIDMNMTVVRSALKQKQVDVNMLVHNPDQAYQRFGLHLQILHIEDVDGIIYFRNLDVTGPMASSVLPITVTGIV